jgi:uncharacterized membrane protein
MLKLDEKKLLFLLIFLHLLIALPLAYYLNIWVDEASTLHTTANGLYPAMVGALRDENQSPLYFWIASVWRMADGSIFWLRIFSVLCSVISIKFSYDAAKRFLPEQAQKFAIVVFALHPFLFWASTETRGYSLTILLSALLLRFFYDAYLEDRPTLQAQIGYILISAVALYAHYFLGFFLVGNFVALVAIRKPKRAAIYLSHMVAVGLLFLPLFIAFSSQLGNRHGIGDQTLWDGIRNSWQNVQTLILPVNMFTDEKNIAAIIRLWLFRAGILAIAAALIWKRFIVISAKTVALGVITLVISLFLMSVVTLLGVGYANVRHASILVLPLILFFTALIYELFAKKGLIVWAIMLCVLIPISTWQQFGSMTKRGDWEKVAAFVKANEQPGQQVLIFDPYDSLAFTVYYKGAATVIPRSGYFAWQRENHFQAGETSLQRTELLLQEIDENSREVWLLTDEACELEKSAAACQPLEDFFNSRYTVVKDERFYLERVRLYRKN